MLKGLLVILLFNISFVITDSYIYLIDFKSKGKKNTSGLLPFKLGNTYFLFFYDLQGICFTLYCEMAVLPVFSS